MQQLELSLVTATSPDDDTSDDASKSSFTTKTKAMLQFLRHSFVGDQQQPSTGSKRKRGSSVNGKAVPLQPEVRLPDAVANVSSMLGQA